MGNPWDERFARDDYAYGTNPNDFLAAVAGKIPFDPILCMAEGEGRNAVFLASLGHSVLAVDSSEVGLQKARKLAETKGVSIQTQLADLEHFKIQPASFGAIVSIWCHLHQSIRPRIHRDVVAGLKPGGALVLEAYTPDQLGYKTGGPPVQELLMQLSDLKSEFAGLKFEIAHEIVREIHEGRLHNGPSAVVQILAFKPPL